MSDEPVVVVSDGDEVAEVVPDVDEGAGVDGSLDEVVLPDGTDLDALRGLLDEYNALEEERYDALSSQVAEGVKVVRSALGDGKSGDAKGAEGATLVSLDDDQWQFVHDSLRVQSTCGLLTLCMVCVLCGVVLWVLFTRGWGHR